jgi:ribosomal protein S12 methylthiotransferase accessory factor YcaO
VHHVAILERLETQMTTWVPGKGASPDRVDALVHAITELAGSELEESHIATPARSNNLPQRGWNAPSKVLGYQRTQTGLLLPGQYR